MQQQLDIFQKIEEIKKIEIPYRSAAGFLLPWELVGYCKKCGYELSEDLICENCEYTEIEEVSLND